MFIYIHGDFACSRTYVFDVFHELDVFHVWLDFNGIRVLSILCCFLVSKVFIPLIHRLIDFVLLLVFHASCGFDVCSGVYGFDGWVGSHYLQDFYVLVFSLFLMAPFHDFVAFQ